MQTKLSSTTWWIGGILGMIIGALIAKEDDHIGMALCGIIDGVVFGWVIGFALDKILTSAPAKEISQKVEEKKQNTILVKDTENSINDYNEAKHKFKYLSDETLTEKYKILLDNEVVNTYRLALEEELVNRGIISHSPMHEKLDKINTHFGL